MFRFFRSHPFVFLLLPLVAVILLAYYTSWPVNLLRDTEVDLSDTLPHYYPVVITSSPVACAHTVRYQALVSLPSADKKSQNVHRASCIVHSSQSFNISFSVYLYFALPDSSVCDVSPVASDQFSLGDSLLVFTSFRRPEPLPDFDYGTYLRRQHIAATAYVPLSSWILLSSQSISQSVSPGAPMQTLGVPRQTGKTNSRKGAINSASIGRANPLSGVSAAVIARLRSLSLSSPTLLALTLGYREDLDPATQRAFSAAGAMHILAVSGLHTGILMGLLMALFTLFGLCPPLYHNRLHRRLIAAAVILCLWFYAVLTGLSPSVVRSVIMCTVYMLAYAFYRRPFTFNTLAAAAFFILLFRPLDLFSVSFQLSFAAVLSIVLFYPFFFRLLPPPMPDRYDPPVRQFAQILAYFYGCIMVSLAAQIGTMPFTFYYFGQFSNYFLLTNIVVLPLAFLIMLFTLLVLTIGWLPGVGEFLACPLRWLVDGLDAYVFWIESLPGSVFRLPSSLEHSLPFFGVMMLVVVSLFLLFRPLSRRSTLSSL
ncbi:MAG: ComEC family competence protein [Paludibacteraceae bacterium]|nr:ComEC family competence protein [Paludibacteraceae bacterium]